MRYENAPDRVMIPRSVVIVVLAALVVTALGSFGAGYLVATGNLRTPPGMKVFWEAWNLADSEFYYDKPSDQERIYGAIRGMLATYQDQFTAFAPPEAAAADNQVMQGESGGIGARIGVDKEGQLVVTEAMIGKPAALAGVRNGDIITAVDGQTIKDLALAEAVRKIRGPIGTSVKLTLKRLGNPDSLTVSVTREQINVYGKMLPGNIAYISLALFSRTAPDEVKGELERLMKEKPIALVFDLRGNPGGYLDEALKVGDLFLSAGPIASERTSDGDNQNYSAKTGEIGENIPMVVLVDKGSASAAEIVAGALQDRKRAILIGQQTYGKGSVQNLHTLSDGSELRVTHGAWYTPNETPIQRNGQHIGLTPNIVVTVPETLDLGQDPILDAAMGYIQSIF